MISNLPRGWKLSVICLQLISHQLHVREGFQIMAIITITTDLKALKTGRKHEPWCTEVRMDSMAPGRAGSLGGPLTG